MVGCILHLVRAREQDCESMTGSLMADDARDNDGLTLKVTANKERHTGMKGSSERVETVGDTIQNSDNPN